MSAPVTLQCDACKATIPVPELPADADRAAAYEAVHMAVSGHRVREHPGVWGIRASVPGHMAEMYLISLNRLTAEQLASLAEFDALLEALDDPDHNWRPWFITVPSSGGAR